MYIVYFCWSVFFFFFKQKTAYEMRISDWSSDVCSSDLDVILTRRGRPAVRLVPVSPTLTNEKKAARIAAIVADAKRKIRPGPDAEHCSDFLYDDKIGRASCRERVCQYV